MAEWIPPAAHCAPGRRTASAAESGGPASPRRAQQTTHPAALVRCGKVFTRRGAAMFRAPKPGQDAKDSDIHTPRQPLARRKRLCDGVDGTSAARENEQPFHTEDTEAARRARRNRNNRASHGAAETRRDNRNRTGRAETGPRRVVLRVPAAPRGVLPASPSTLLGGNRKGGHEGRPFRLQPADEISRGPWRRSLPTWPWALPRTARTASSTPHGPGSWSAGWWSSRTFPTAAPGR